MGRNVYCSILRLSRIKLTGYTRKSVHTYIHSRTQSSKKKNDGLFVTTAKRVKHTKNTIITYRYTT